MTQQQRILEMAIGTIVGILGLSFGLVGIVLMLKSFVHIVKFLVLDLLLGAFHHGKKYREEVKEEDA
jgi:hypothetical protein